ncbi:MAG: hypothetical protein P1V97_28110 [Planctomycetota bacterium]|nr:hypothetical protein [Planctomycetota bacterium]
MLKPRVTRRRKWLLSGIVILCGLVSISVYTIKELREQYSIELIADFKLELNNDGKTGAVSLLYHEEVASDKALDSKLREHAKSICAYRAATFISTIEAMLNENESYRIWETMHLSNEIFEDPEIMRAEFLYRTGGLAAGGERIHLNFLREQLKEIGAPTNNIDLDKLKSWFQEKFGLTVEYSSREGPTHPGESSDCSNRFRVFTNKYGDIRRQALRKKYLPLRKSLLEPVESD